MRRGVGLALALVTVWCISLTADLTGAKEALSSLGEQPAIAVGLLSAQTGVPPQDAVTAGFDLWGRLLLNDSPLLSAGKEGVANLRADSDSQEKPDVEPQDVPDDNTEEPILEAPTQDGDILEMTAQGKEGGKYLSDSGIYLYNRADLALTPSVITEGSVNIALGDAPQILIVHTHGSEAYSQTDGELYQESDPYRTTDCSKNVVRVGEEMAQVFRSHGFQVVHDTNLYDYPAYNGAYDRSGAAVKKWLEQYPTVQIIFDVHRDALLDTEGTVYKLVSQENGEKVAQVMFVLGSPGGGLEHPNWKNNLALAVRFQTELQADYVSLARPMVLRNSRYNQQLSQGSLLVEVGGHGNTLTEAIAGAKLFAESASQVMLGMKS